MRRPAHIVERVLQLFAGFEFSRSAGGNLDRFAGLRIATGPRFAHRNRKGAEARDVYPLARLERGDDIVEHDVDRFFGLILVHSKFVRQPFDKIGLRHSSAPAPPAWKNWLYLGGPSKLHGPPRSVAESV